MTDSIANPSTISAAAKTAVAGDTIRLAPGAYSAVRLKSLQKGAVTITSEDPASPARFTNGLTLDKPASLRFVGVDFDLVTAPQNHAAALVVNGGEDLSMLGCRFNGVVREDGARAGRGLVINNVMRLSIQKNQFTKLYRGMVVSGCEDVLIAENDLLDLGSDGIDIERGKRIEIARNLIDGLTPLGDDHPDGIQFWTVTGAAANEDVVVADNLIACGLGRRAQGIFIRAENDAAGHRRFKILRNLLINVGWHGISAGLIEDLELAGNRLLFQPPADGADPKCSWIKATGSSGRIADNRAMRMIDIASDAGANVEIPAATAEEVAEARASWKAKLRPSGTSPEPVPAPPTRDALREIIARRTGVKQEPLKTKGRVSLDFKTPAEADVFLEAVQAVGR